MPHRERSLVVTLKFLLNGSSRGRPCSSSSRTCGVPSVTNPLTKDDALYTRPS